MTEAEHILIYGLDHFYTYYYRETATISMDGARLGISITFLSTSHAGQRQNFMILFLRLALFIIIHWQRSLV
jgi:hypothetical protein